MRVCNLLNIPTTAYSLLVVILGLLRSTIAQDYLKGAIDGHDYIKGGKFHDGVSKYSI